MTRLKAQIGTAVTADFEENTWTFEMPEGFSVSAGEFVIIPKEKYTEEAAYWKERAEAAENYITCGIDNHDEQDALYKDWQRLKNHHPQQ